MIAKGWDAFELTETKGREKSGGCTSESEEKDAEALNYAAAAAAAKSLQSCPTLFDPIDGSPPDFPTLGFSRQEHRSGLPFPSPMHESEK